MRTETLGDLDARGVVCLFTSVDLSGGGEEFGRNGVI